MSKDTYVQKAVTSKISATSRASVKIRDSYFTIEFSEERVFPETATDIDLDAEKEALWDSVNTEVDNQIESIMESMRSK